MYKGIIFDLDGTIADTMGDLMTAMNHMLAHYGFPVRTREDLLKNINGGAVNFVRQSLPEHVRGNDEFVQEAFENYIAKYRTCYCDTTNLYDGIAETAYAAKQMGIKLAVHSNKQHEQTVDIIEKLFKPGTFDIIIGYSEFPHKPDPTASIYIAEQFNAEPNEILFVGDSDVDIATATNAGMFSVGVSWGYRSVDVLISKGINAIVTEAKQILNFLGNTNEVNKASWNEYQEDYFKFNLMYRPDYFEFFANGGVDDIDEHVFGMLGDVKGLKLLDTCCACDASQAFSWHNLGAIVTACDITPKAIEIASANAAKMNLDIEFVVTDMQKLDPIGDNLYDIVFTTYPCWVQDLNEACRNWHRVLKHGGKLLLNTPHPILDAIEDDVDYNHPFVTIEENWSGTPLADRFGGWNGNLPSVGNSHRVCDILNAVCDAGFTIKKTHEASCHSEGKLPDTFTVLAIK